MKNRLLVNTIRSLVILTLILIHTAVPVAAQTPEPPGMESAVEPITTLVHDLAISLIKLLTFLGGVIFVVTVVVGAARGTLGSALGNQMQASQGIMSLIMGAAALVLMLLVVPLANNLLSMLVARLLTPEAMHIPDIAAMAGTQPIDLGTPGTAQDLLQIPALQEAITSIALTIVRVFITLGSIVFVVSVMLGALDTQIGHLMGGGMLASRGIMRILTSVGAVALLILSFPLSKWILNALVPLILPSIEISLPF